MFYRLLSCLPLPLLYALGWPCYLLLYHVAGYRKATVRQNLRQAFPEQSEKEITVLAKKFYRQLVDVALEIVRTRRMSAAELRRRVTVRNGELLQRCHDPASPPTRRFRRRAEEAWHRPGGAAPGHQNHRKSAQIGGNHLALP